MNKQGIELAREWIDLPDTLTDEEIAEGLRGSFTETRIEFHLAWVSFWRVAADAVGIWTLVLPIAFLTCFAMASFIVAMKVIFGVGYWVYLLSPALVFLWLGYGRLTQHNEK